MHINFCNSSDLYLSSVLYIIFIYLSPDDWNQLFLKRCVKIVFFLIHRVSRSSRYKKNTANSVLQVMKNGRSSFPKKKIFEKIEFKNHFRPRHLNRLLRHQTAASSAQSIFSFLRVNGFINVGCVHHLCLRHRVAWLSFWTKLNFK